MEAAPPTRKAVHRTHRVGEPVYVNDYDRIAEAERRERDIPPELLSLLRLAWIALLSPLLLLCAWVIVQRATHDVIGQDNSRYLVAWGCVVAVLALSQIVSRSTAIIPLRKALIVLTIATTAVASVGYIYLASISRATALGSKPERTFELHERVSGRSFRWTKVSHQRADGRLLEGGYRPPVRWGHACTLAQRLTGDYGFTWVRVLKRSRSRYRGELYWPIRRDECFSGIPLESLPR